MWHCGDESESRTQFRAVKMVDGEQIQTVRSVQSIGQSSAFIFSHFKYDIVVCRKIVQTIKIHFFPLFLFRLNLLKVHVTRRMNHKFIGAAHIARFDRTTQHTNLSTRLPPKSRVKSTMF